MHLILGLQIQILYLSPYKTCLGVVMLSLLLNLLEWTEDLPWIVYYYFLKLFFLLLFLYNVVHCVSVLINIYYFFLLRPSPVYEQTGSRLWQCHHHCQVAPSPFPGKPNMHTECWRRPQYWSIQPSGVSQMLHLNNQQPKCSTACIIHSI